MIPLSTNRKLAASIDNIVSSHTFTQIVSLDQRDVTKITNLGQSVNSLRLIDGNWGQFIYNKDYGLFLNSAGFAHRLASGSDSIYLGNSINLAVYSEEYHRWQAAYSYVVLSSVEKNLLTKDDIQRITKQTMKDMKILAPYMKSDAIMKKIREVDSSELPFP